MSWRWQGNHNPWQISAFLTHKQQQQQQQQIRWLQEYQHQLTQQQLQPQVQQQHPLQRRVLPPLSHMPFLRPSESIYSQARSARRDLYEDILSTRTSQRTTENDYRHNILFHEGENNMPFNAAKTEVLYPDHRNRRLLNGVHETRTGTSEEYNSRHSQQTTDNYYRYSDLYNSERQNRFSCNDERTEIFHTGYRNRSLLNESNELQRRMWRSQTPRAAFEIKRAPHWRHRDSTVGPHWRSRRYRSKSVGPELGYQRKHDTDSRGNRNSGEDQLFFKRNSSKDYFCCSVDTDVGEGRKRNSRHENAKCTGPSVCDENMFKMKHNAYSEMHRRSAKKRKVSKSPAKDKDEIRNKRGNGYKQEKIEQIAHQSSVVPNSDSAFSSTQKSSLFQENQIENSSITGITRMVSNELEEAQLKQSSVEDDVNAQNGSRKWQQSPLKTVQSVSALNRHHTHLSGITRTLLNVNAERTPAHKVGERNHRLRSFREEEEEDENTQDDDDDDDENEDEGGGEGEGDTHENELTKKNIEAKSVEHEAKIDMYQQTTCEPDNETEYTKESKSDCDDEKEQQQQFGVPEYNSNVPVGRSLLKWTLGLRCRMCHQFFLEFEQAEEHCQTLEHYNNYLTRISELQRALNIDLMDGAKALELEKLLEDEPPSCTPPGNSYLSKMHSDLM